MHNPFQKPASSPLIWLGVLLMGLLTAMGHAQPAFGQPGDMLANQVASQPEDDQAPPVVFSLIPSAESYAPGASGVLALVLDHAEHYHSNLHEPIVPEAMGDFYPVPTTLSLPQIPTLTFGEVQWPAPTTVPVDFSFSGNPIDYQVYSGKAVIYIPFTISQDAQSAPQSIDITIRYQVCDDTICLVPASESVETTINIDPNAQQITDLPDLFAGYDPTKPTDTPSTTKSSEPAHDASAAGNSSKFFGIPIPGGGFAGLIMLALLGIAGGFILNLTPCVLPVIPIKIMTLSQHAGENRAKTAMLGFWMALGVIAFWAALAIPVLTLQNFADPSRIFGIWWLTTGIGLIIAILSLGLIGMFQINLPQRAYMVNPKADTPYGSFVFGIMTAILGLPCFGFVAGALVPIASTQGKVFVIVLFTSLGIGMAAPYLVLSIFPQLVKKLPKTGPASELVKQIMALLLLSAAAYFVGSGLIALVASKPYLAKLLHLWVAAIFGIAAGAWLLIQTFRISKKPLNRGVFSIIAIVIAALGILVVTRFTSDAKEDYLLLQAARAETAGQGILLKTTWNDYNPQSMQKALDEGRIVIQDFTAEWCINCKVLEKTVLGTKAVKEQFKADDTVMFKVDLTGTNPDGEKALADLGRTGIPTLAIYGPGLETPWVANAYTPEQVVNAIQRARGN